MKLSVFIPAGMASTRFPGKPLVDILGMPMIEHVRRRALLNPDVSSAIVATCDQEIVDVVESYGGQAVMTDQSHFSCNDRVSEAAFNIDADIIVNIQGDEPLFNPDMISYLISPMKYDSSVVCTNLMSLIETEQEFNNVNVVKVVCDISGNALYMSREPIPSKSKSKSKSFDCFKILGIYAFRKPLLMQFLSWGPSPIETIETIDMIRLLEHGQQVRMVVSPFQSIGVDTPEDLIVAKNMMSKDALFGKY